MSAEKLSVQMRDWDRLNRPSDAGSYAEAVASLEAALEREFLETQRLRAALQSIVEADNADYRSCGDCYQIAIAALESKS